MKIKVFDYIPELDCFIVRKEFQNLMERLDLTEWTPVVWLGRLFCMDNDFGEHWFDNWDEREEIRKNHPEIVKTIFEDVPGEHRFPPYHELELMVVVPSRFTDHGAYCMDCKKRVKRANCPDCGKNIHVGPDGPCNTDDFKKLFWTDVLQLNRESRRLNMIMELKTKQPIDAKKHFGLVGHISKRYTTLKKGERIEDTEEFSDGLVGLTRAIEKFDPSKGFQFSTFAFYCIRNEICKGMKERQRGVHASIRIDWTDSEIDMPARPEEEPSFVKAGRVVEALLDKLPEDTEPKKKNKQILIDYYLNEKMLKEIGMELGVTRERIRQRREQALSQLKKVAGSLYVKERGNYGKKEPEKTEAKSQ